MKLPKGLAETVEAFAAGCDAKNKRVGADVAPSMIERFRQTYTEHENSWGDVGVQLLTVMRLAGRLAALYAELDRKFAVEWVHARFALRDAQAECAAGLGPRGKHVHGADLTS